MNPPSGPEAPRGLLHHLALRLAGSRLRLAVRSLLNVSTSVRGRVRVARLRGPGAGLRMRLDWHSQKSYAFGVYEPRVVRLLLDRVRPGMVVWDVGAHVGYYTLLLGRAVGPAGHVVAFEPLPANREVLQENVRLNGLSNVTVLPCALGSARGRARLTFAGEKVLPAASTLLGGQGNMEVDVETGDALVGKGIPAPDFLKIDVEGAEALALEGLEGVLRASRPIVLCELHGQRFPGEVARARAILARHDYHLEADLLEPEWGWELVHILASKPREDAP